MRLGQALTVLLSMFSITSYLEHRTKGETLAALEL